MNIRVGVTVILRGKSYVVFFNTTGYPNENVRDCVVNWSDGGYKWRNEYCESNLFPFFCRKPRMRLYARIFGRLLHQLNLHDFFQQLAVLLMRQTGVQPRDMSVLEM